MKCNICKTNFEEKDGSYIKVAIPGKGYRNICEECSDKIGFYLASIPDAYERFKEKCEIADITIYNLEKFVKRNIFEDFNEIPF